MTEASATMQTINRLRRARNDAFNGKTSPHMPTHQALKRSRRAAKRLRMEPHGDNE